MKPLNDAFYRTLGADVDAPETHEPRCAEERALGDRATVRLQQLLNSGEVTLAKVDRDMDVYGRKLRIVEVNGSSVGDTLVGELFDERHSPISAKIRSRFENTRTWKIALGEHEAILKAVEARDPIAAQAAMRAHLKASAQRWVGD